MLVALLYALCMVMVSHLVGVDSASLGASTTTTSPTTPTTSTWSSPTVPDPATDEALQTTRPIRITILYDNQTLRPDLRSDWGFACLIEGWEKTVLFDTGDEPDILFGNMRVLGIDPEDIDAVVLSHAHQDHTGGLSAILACNSDIEAYFPASFSQGFVRAVQKAGATAIPVKEAGSVCPGVMVTAPLGSSPQEIGLVVDSEGGPILVTGCAHPGVAAMAKAAAELADGSLYAVLGGFHLASRPTAQVEAIIEDLRQFGVRRCGPAHCTGPAATAQIKKGFGAGFIEVGVGAVLEF